MACSCVFVVRYQLNIIATFIRLCLTKVHDGEEDGQVLVHVRMV